MRPRDTFHRLPGQGRAAKTWFIPAYNGAGPRSRTVRIRSHAYWKGRGLHMSRNTVCCECKNIHIEASSSIAAWLPSQAKATLKILSGCRKYLCSDLAPKSLPWVCYRVNSRPFTLFYLERLWWFHLFHCYPTLGRITPRPLLFWRCSGWDAFPHGHRAHRENRVCIGAMNSGPLIDTSWLITGGKKNNSITPSFQLEQMRKCVW